MKTKPTLAVFRGLAFISLSVILFSSSCKKSDSSDDPNTAAGKENLLKDSVYLYTREVYLWEDVLPGSFFPRKYANADSVLETLKSYKKDAQGNILDRYSFLDRTGSVAGEIQDGVLGDFGFDVRYNADDDLRVKSVYANSPAGLAGIERSWRILAINGKTAISQTDLQPTDFSFIYSALAASSIQLKLQKPDNTIADYTLTSREYAIDPILFSNVYTLANGKKVGYFVFNTFVAISNKSVPTATKARIDAVMKSFETAGVTEVVVDLRYNGGGAVETADYLTNMLVPSSVNGQLMYSYRMNKILSADKDFQEAFAPVNISKKGSLNPASVYFIVTRGTASASELLINNLKPFMNVKLIGETATYGKPVGFFGIRIFDADLYAISFETVNSQGVGQYYSGITVDKSERDDLTHAFGSTEERCLAQALYFAQNNVFKTSVASTSSVKGVTSVASSVDLNKNLDQKGNKDMFKFKVPVKPLP